MVSFSERKGVDLDGVKNLVCANCGFRLGCMPRVWFAAKLHIVQTGGFGCPACTARDQWMKVGKAPKSVLEDDTWMLLLKSRNPEMFKSRGFKLNNRYRRFFNDDRGKAWVGNLVEDVPEDLK